MRIWMVVVSVSLFAMGCSDVQMADAITPRQDQSSTDTCGGQVITNNYIVRYKNGETKSFKYESREQFKADVVVPQLSTISYIEFDQRFTVEKPVDPGIQTKSIDNWGLSRVNAATAWQQGVTGAGITVGIVDSGVDISHSQLQNQIAYNLGESGLDSHGRDKRTNGIDDDGNGVVDDYAGYDFADNTPTMIDEAEHGTHVAGIVAAEHHDTIVRTDMVQGLAPGAKILPVKFIGANGGSLDNAIKSLEYARKMHVKIINASWGGAGCSRALNDKIQDVVDSGIIFVVASGNSGANLDIAPEYPAALRHSLQVTVGASGMQDGMSSFSNYSRTLVNLFAPGFNIYSTLPGNQIGAESGTSMATPYVSAALALLWSAKPNSSASEVISALYAGVSKDPNYMNSTEGRLDVAASLAAINSFNVTRGKL